MRTTDAPKLTEGFTFTLDAKRDRAVREFVETLSERSETKRLLDLDTANASLLLVRSICSDLCRSS